MLEDFEEVEKVPTPQAFLLLVKQLNSVAYEKEAANSLPFDEIGQ